MSASLLECRQITKSFAGVPVLRQVDFQVAAASVVGLVGENGAGKSTLMNILGGVLSADDGKMLLAGRAYAPRDPADAAARGVRIVHQEFNLFPNLTLAENLFLDRLPQGPLGIRRGALCDRARASLNRVGLARDPFMLVERLSTGEKQLLEIAKALDVGAKLIVFDEPTTSLTQPEAARLFDIIGQLRRQGIGIIYISHRLDDVLRLADDMLILRDGSRQAFAPASSFSIPTIIRHMVGRDVDQVFPPRSAPLGDEVALDLRNITRRGVVEDITLQVRCGEIVGLAGMMGSGRSALARLVFGLEPLDVGEIAIAGRPVVQPSANRSRALGAAFVTEDRRGEGLMLNASVDDNMLLASWPNFARAGWLQRRRARNAALHMADSLRIGGARERAVGKLSGGNQQKVVFARWLMCKPQILILDEPTRGVDVGAKEEIYQIIRRITDEGAAILLISSEIEELLGLADRIAVLRAGHLVGEFHRDEFNRECILACALGQEAAA